jgi:hypothetical protein
MRQKKPQITSRFDVGVEGFEPRLSRLHRDGLNQLS